MIGFKVCIVETLYIITWQGLFYRNLVSLKMSDERGGIISLHRAGKLDFVIANTLSIAISTVRKAVKRYTERSVQCPRSVRPRSQRSK